MEQNFLELEKKPNKLALQASLAFTVYFLLLIFIFKFLEINAQNQNLSTGSKIISQFLSYIPFILAIVYVQTNYKKELGGFVTFGRAFSAGFKVAAYSGLFLFILQVIYYFIDKQAIQELMDIAIESADGDEQKIKGIEMMKPYMGLFIGFGTAMTYTVFGLVISLVGAAIIKKEVPLYSDQD